MPKSGKPGIFWIKLISSIPSKNHPGSTFRHLLGDGYTVHTFRNRACVRPYACKMNGHTCIIMYHLLTFLGEPQFFLSTRVFNPSGLALKKSVAGLKTHPKSPRYGLYGWKPAYGCPNLRKKTGIRIDINSVFYRHQSNSYKRLHWYHKESKGQKQMCVQ